MERLIVKLLPALLGALLCPAAATLAQQPDTLTLPAGTSLQIRLLNTLSSKNSSAAFGLPKNHNTGGVSALATSAASEE